MSRQASERQGRTIEQIRLVRSRSTTRSDSFSARRSSDTTFDLSSSLYQSPIDEWIVNERFENGDDRFLVLAKNSHRILTGDLERSFDTGDLYNHVSMRREE